MEVDECGFTEQEALVMRFLMGAQTAYYKLDQQHPSEQKEWEFAMHQLQGLLGIRVLRREYPEGWPTHRGGE